MLERYEDIFGDLLAPYANTARPFVAADEAVYEQIAAAMGIPFRKAEGRDDGAPYTLGRVPAYVDHNLADRNSVYRWTRPPLELDIPEMKAALEFPKWSGYMYPWYRI